MRKLHIALVLTTLLSTQAVLADNSMSASPNNANDPCHVIAKACKDAGFSRKGHAGKLFWVDCMKPIVTGKAVKGVTVDDATVKACRSKKIDEIKKDLNDMQNAS